MTPPAYGPYESERPLLAETGHKPRPGLPMTLPLLIHTTSAWPHGATPRVPIGRGREFEEWLRTRQTLKELPCAKQSGVGSRAIPDAARGGWMTWTPVRCRTLPTSAG